MQLCDGSLRCQLLSWLSCCVEWLTRPLIQFWLLVPGVDFSQRYHKVSTRVWHFAQYRINIKSSHIKLVVPFVSVPSLRPQTARRPTNKSKTTFHLCIINLHCWHWYHNSTEVLVLLDFVKVRVLWYAKSEVWSGFGFVLCLGWLLSFGLPINMDIIILSFHSISMKSLCLLQWFCSSIFRCYLVHVHEGRRAPMLHRRHFMDHVIMYLN